MIGFTPFKGRGRSVSIKIEGLKALHASFDRLAKKSDSLMTREIHLAAQRIAERANRDVPVDTGALLKSIKVEKNSKGATVSVNEKYAGYVEKGTRNMKAQPYFFKHIDPSVQKMIRNLKRLMTL